MRIVSFIAAAFLLTTAVFGKSIPEVDSKCADSIAEEDFCSKTTAPLIKGAVDVEMFVVVSKDYYPTVQSILDKYLTFNDWPEYVELSGMGVPTFATSEDRGVKTVEKNGKAVEVRVHYADYTSPAPPPVLNHRVSGEFHYQNVTPYSGAVMSMEFASQPGGTGLEAQSGSIHALDCSTVSVCGDDQWLLYYETSVQSSIDILPRLAAPSVLAPIESIVIGMLLINE